MSVAAAHTDHFVVSLQHTSCAASVHVVNGIHDYVMKATINSVAASVHYVNGIHDYVMKAT